MNRLALRSVLAVTALLSAACSDGATSAPKPAALTATVTTTSTATVGTAVAAAPAVKVADASGAAVSGVTVQFAVISGGGTLGRTSAVTDASGVASAGSWTLGTTSGANAVDATVAGLPVVHFSATGTAGAAASIVATAGDNQAAMVGAAVSTVPAVIVKDQYGNLVTGATVTFSVVSGGGVITGATATTGTDGIARLGGWTLGIATGAQQIRATTGTLSATLTATASVPTGCAVTNYAFGATLALSWDATDCSYTTSPTGVTVAGRKYDRLQFTLTGQQYIDAAVTAPDGRQLLLRNATTGLYVGLQPSPAFSPPAQNPMHMKYLLAAGTYVFEPVAPSATATGAYTFATTPGGKVSCDVITFASTNVQFTDTIDQQSCIGPFGSPEQWINLQLKTGTKIRLTLSSTDFVPILVFRDDRQGPASPTLVSKFGTAAGETLVIDYTATFDSWHEVVVAPRTATLGKYTLKIEELP